MRKSDGGSLFGRRTAAVGLALILLVAAADALLDPGEGLVLTPMLVVGPLVAAVRARVGQVAFLAALATAVSAPLAALDDDFFEPGHFGTVIAVGVAGVIAVVVARMRTRLEESAARRGRELAGERLARRRAELLARAGELLEAPLDEAERLRAIAGLPVPDLAQLTSIDLLDDNGKFRSTIAHSTDPALVEAVLKMRRLYPIDSRSAHPLATVARSGVPLVLDEIPEALLSDIAVNEEHLALLLALRYRAAVVVPLAIRGRIVGVMAMLRIGEAAPFHEHDVETARELTRRVAPAIDNARLIGELRATEARLEAVVDTIQEAVVAFAPDGKLVFVNRAALELAGATSAEELVGRTWDELASSSVVLDIDGTPLGPDELPVGRVLAGLDAEPVTLQYVDRDSNQARWLVSRATPVRGDDGEVELVVHVIEDVTVVKREEIRQRFLAAASKLISSSLDVGATLDKAAWAAVPEICDWARVDIPDEHGRLCEVAVAHRDVDKIELLREWRRDYPPDPADTAGPWEVLRSGRPVIWPSVSDADIERYAQSPRHAELMRAIATRSLVIVPLRIGDRILGTLELATTADSERLLGDPELDLALELAERAAIATEHARVHEARTHVATTLQRSLLPPELPKIPGLALAARFRATGGASDVGGDFYDVFPAGDGWIVVVGDVTGKGPEAAATTSLARYTARTAALYEPAPERILARLDEVLAAEGASRRLCTAVCARVDTGPDGVRLSVCCAGHPLPLVITSAGDVREAGRPTPLLGAFPEVQRACEQVTLADGEVLVLYTDGVTDAIGAADRFGSERLAEVLRAAGPQDPDVVAAHVDAALSTFENGPQRDDVALLVLRAEIASFATER